MAKASKFEPFHGDICEALRDRARQYSKARKMKEKAETARDTARDSMKDSEEGTTKRSVIEAEYGRQCMAIDELGKHVTWAKNEIIMLIEDADDLKLIQDVKIKSKPPKRGEKEDKDQQKLGEGEEDGKDEE